MATLLAWLRVCFTCVLLQSAAARSVMPRDDVHVDSHQWAHRRHLVLDASKLKHGDADLQLIRTLPEHLGEPVKSVIAYY